MVNRPRPRSEAIFSMMRMRKMNDMPDLPQFDHGCGGDMIWRFEYEDD
jgi:hypothetical protein